jgi:hypothetical protein
MTSCDIFLPRLLAFVHELKAQGAVRFTRRIYSLDFLFFFEIIIPRLADQDHRNSQGEWYVLTARTILITYHHR